MLDRLETRGYLTRRLHPTDRRSLLVVLTPNGLTVAKAVVDLLREIEESIRSHVGDRDVEGFLAVVDAVVQVTT